jgi:hypothetical protein
MTRECKGLDERTQTGGRYLGQELAGRPAWFLGFATLGTDDQHPATPVGHHATNRCEHELSECYMPSAAIRVDTIRDLILGG